VRAVLYKTGADLRRSWRSALVLVVLVGVVGGGVIACTAGARRTASAYPRLREASNAAELMVSPNGELADPEPLLDSIGGLAGVRDLAPLQGLALVTLPDSPLGWLEVEGAIVGLDGRASYEIERPKLFRGRLPAPDRADEVLVNPAIAAQGIDVGDRLDLVLVHTSVLDAADDTAPALDQHRPGSAVPVPVTVVGVGATTDEIVPFTLLSSGAWFRAPPALAEMAGRENVMFDGILVDAEPGADLNVLRREIDRISAELAEQLPGGLFVVDQTAQAARVQDGIRPVAVALGMFAFVLGAVAAVVVGLLLRRHVATQERDATTLESLGFTGRERQLASMLRAGAIGLTGSVVAVATALLLSPRFPIGPARAAEPDPGSALDPAVLIGGFAVVVGWSLLASVGAVQRPRRAAAAGTGPLPIGLSPTAPAAAGLRVGLRSGRAAIAGGVVGIAAVVASAVFGATLDELVTNPARFGQQWDRTLDTQFGHVPLSDVAERYRDDDRVTGMAAGSYGELRTGDVTVAAVSWQPLKGSVSPLVVQGRIPAAPGEVALGGESMERLGVTVGDDLDADAGAGTGRYEVVGQVVLPRFSLGVFASTGLGTGALLHPDDLPTPPVSPDLDPARDRVDGHTANFVAFDLDGAPSTLDDELRRRSDDELAYVVEELRPTTISDLDRVRAVPALLAGTLAVLALGTLAYSLTVSVRDRRRELAVLKALGFDRSQLGSTVRWQSSSITLSALLIGVPAGVVGGRLLWHAFVQNLHLPADPATPAAVLVAVVAAVYVVGHLVALVPARRAGRVRAAHALRAE
jgi:ABC-type lipoprotein release transport system permease subunit